MNNPLLMFVCAAMCLIYITLAGIQGRSPKNSTIMARVDLPSEASNRTKWQAILGCTVTDVFNQYVGTGTFLAMASIEVAGSFAVGIARSRLDDRAAASFVGIVKLAHTGCVSGFIAYVFHTLIEVPQSDALEMTPRVLFNETVFVCGDGGMTTSLNPWDAWKFYTFVAAFALAMFVFWVDLYSWIQTHKISFTQLAEECCGCFSEFLRIYPHQNPVAAHVW